MSDASESAGSAGARSDVERRGDASESSGSAGARSDAERRGDMSESSGSAGARSDAERRGDMSESSGSAGARSDAERRGDMSESSGSAGARSDAERRGDMIDRLIAEHGVETVCAALAPLMTAERIARIEQVLAARLASVVTLVEDTYDPHNAAAAIRTTEALGLCELHAVEPNERFSSAHGVTIGAHKWIDLVRWPDARAAIDALHARGFRVHATLAGATTTIDEVAVASPIVIAFGNEHAGLTPDAIAACDGAIAIPMLGFSGSFNLSVAVALAMSRVAARRRAWLGASGDLPAERMRLLRARWYALSVRAAVGIVERFVERSR